LERRTVVVTSWGVALLSAVAAAVLVLPVANSLRVGVVVVESLLLGLLNAVQQVFLLQCLGRGTTEQGRARAFKLAFTFGPLAAVAGSLLAQFVQRGGIPALVFPRDFAALYLLGILCAAAMAWCCGRLELPPLAEVPHPRFFSFLWEGFKRYLQSRDMILLWFAYLLWYGTFLFLPNLSLFARQAMGREPADFSGLMMAILFGSKAAAGYAFGALCQKYGVRAPLIGTMAAVGLSLLWAWVVPGYFYLAAFAFMGAGQLGGIYFLNVLPSWSSPLNATRDMAVLNLAPVAASPAPEVYGFATDRWGFSASFILGIASAVAGLALVLRLPIRRSREAAAAPPETAH